jgi:spermidine synthase
VASSNPHRVSSFLLFLSGFSALVYQVLWMRDLAVVFGSSARASAVVLAVFFGGMALGAALFARFAARVRRPLLVYGLLELGIALSALLFLVTLDAYTGVYTSVYSRFAGSLPVLTAAKSALAVAVLGLPTVLMGATLPAMVQHGRRGAWLYGMNTAGAAAGAFAAGFYLPPAFGFRASYLIAVAINAVAGLAAIAMGRSAAAPPPIAPASAARVGRPGEAQVTLSRRTCLLLAGASGALTIGLEVTWLRMFAQVLDNSVYAFSAVVVVALVAFALAALLVARLAQPDRVLGGLLLALAGSGVAAALQSPAFAALTDGLAPVSSERWLDYVGRVFALAAIFVGITGFVSGLVFPLLLRVFAAAGAGAVVGRLLALNTIGAIAGSLVTTFLVLRWLGAWGTSAAIAVMYSALAIWLAHAAHARRHRRMVFVAAAATIAAVVTSATLPRVRLAADRGERVLALWEGSHGTVAVTETTDGRLLRLNNSYSLGGTTDRIERERIQTLVPLLLHPDPKRVFFLGLGTGITAGEALRHPVERIVVCELIPEVVRASREFFGEWTRGLAADPRVDVRVEDGRHFLAASEESFDVIVSDLFVPWHAGTGMLYTREHFAIVRARLRRGGVFAQWLPLFQLNRRDFEVIARTLASVFPHVVIWRGDFYANRPIVALVASADPMSLEPAQLVPRIRPLSPREPDATSLARVLPFYVGNLGEAPEAVEEGPLNTDERPMIEFLSPRAQWGGNPDWFVSTALVRFFERLRAAVPIERDPYLSALTRQQRGHVEAGRFYYRAVVNRLRGDDDAAAADLVQALERLPPDMRVSGPFMGLDEVVR